LKMELEFDKEIDAILRKARPARGVLVGDDPPEPQKHLDADVIAAFAENALPEKARLLYIEHFADCDTCRKLLSQTILMNTEAVSSAKEAASSVVADAVAEAMIPWYENLLKTRNLGLAMGALALVFTGLLGYLVLQNNNNAANSSVSQVSEPESSQGGPYYSGESANTAANSTNTASVASNATASNTNGAAYPYDAPTKNPAANAPAGMSSTTSNTSGDALAPVDSADEKKAEKDDKTSAVGGALAQGAKPAPPPSKELPLNGRSITESVVVDGIAGKDADLAKRKQTEDRRETRDLPAPASKVGPSRSGPLQNQSNQANNKLYEMSVKRNVSGKTFENRSGAWYDSAYHGQATTNVRRGTEEYKRLDSGLRNIANVLGGTVVVVWKEKAYRIQ
jgi:hypothetical protein